MMRLSPMRRLSGHTATRENCERSLKLQTTLVRSAAIRHAHALPPGKDLLLSADQACSTNNNNTAEEVEEIKVCVWLSLLPTPCCLCFCFVVVGGGVVIVAAAASRMSTGLCVVVLFVAQHHCQWLYSMI